MPVPCNVILGGKMRIEVSKQGVRGAMLLQYATRAVRSPEGMSCADQSQNPLVVTMRFGTDRDIQALRDAGFEVKKL